MASKSNFIGEFRQAVANMQMSYEAARSLAHLADDLGWDAAALAGQFSTSSDISVEDFVTAMEVIKKIETANVGISGLLAKMRA